MKLSLSPVRAAVVIPCVALLGVSQAQEPSVTAVPPAPDAAPAKPDEKPLEIPDPVATVNGKDISKAQLEDAFANAVKMMGVDAAGLPNSEKLTAYNSLLQDMVMDELLKQQSEGIDVSDEEVDAEIAKIKANFPDEKEFEARLKEFGQTPDKLKELITSGLKQKKWIESQISDKTSVTEDDAKKFYDSTPEAFEQPEQVAASHILFMVPDGATEEQTKKQEDAAKAALEKAKATKTDEEFNELAKGLSEEPGAKESGGNLGYFSKDMMVPEFAEAAFSTKSGDITGPVKTQFGYHIIKVTGKKEAGKVPFDEAKEQIVEGLKQQKQQAALGELIDKVRSEAKIDVKLPQPEAPAPSSDSVPPAPAADDSNAG